MKTQSRPGAVPMLNRVNAKERVLHIPTYWYHQTEQRDVQIRDAPMDMMSLTFSHQQKYEKEQVALSTKVMRE